MPGAQHLADARRAVGVDDERLRDLCEAQLLTQPLELLGVLRVRVRARVRVRVRV